MVSRSSLEDSHHHLPETSEKILAAGSRRACCVDDTNDIAGVPGSSHAWNPLSSSQYLDISVFFFFLHQLLWILFLSLKNEVKRCDYQYNINCKGKSKKKHIPQSFRRSTRILEVLELRRFSSLYKRILYCLSIGLDCSNQSFIHAENSNLAQHGTQDPYDPGPTNSFMSSLPTWLHVLPLQPSKSDPHATPGHNTSLLLLAFVHAVLGLEGPVPVLVCLPKSFLSSKL